MKTLNVFGALVATLLFASCNTQISAQVGTEVPPVVQGAKPVQVEHIKVHAQSIEGNLEGESADRDVIVFLPPSYATSKSRRYPVVYALHGYSIGAEQWTHEIHVPQTIEGAFAKGAQEMIVVLPDSKTVYNGSMYSSSVTTGDFEHFVSHDLVAYIDAHYRTIAVPSARGLVGHSMGGYGTTRISLKDPGIYGAIYIMSPCCLSPMGGGMPLDDKMKAQAIANEKLIAGAKSPAEVAKLLPGFGAAQLATAAAWAPNPKNPPLYLDLPTKDGVPQPEVTAKFAANSPLVFIDQYIGSMKQYRAIGIEAGDQDMTKIDAGKLHQILLNYGIENSFEIYPGTHTSGVAVRFQNFVIPFFSKNLCSKDCK